MSSCAVIVAAGCSSRMGTLKPLLPIAGEPAILHLVKTLLSAGVSHIIVVTGRGREQIEAVCQQEQAVSFVHNPVYATTQMFDSAKIGLRAVPNCCDKILFTPADIPLVSADTVRTVLAREEPLVFPSYQMRRGHPFLLRRSCLSDILKYSGQGGFKGALASLSVPPAYAVVHDPFILMDMDTPADYSALLEKYNGGSDTWQSR